MHTKTGGLTTSSLLLMALGSCVGGSFFLGMNVVLSAAGRSSFLALAIGGVVTYLILMALAELTLSMPARGSFREYAEQAFGPGMGFVVGWVYWGGLVLGLSSEATAAALFLRLWLPGLPVWLLALAIIAMVTVLNLLDVRLFAGVESAMSALKNLAVVAFVLLAVALAVGFWPGRPAVGLGAFAAAPALPLGLGGLAGSMLIVMFCFAGFEVIGLAASEARDPQRTVRRAVFLTALCLVGLFVAGTAALLVLLPLGSLRSDVSPLVVALQVHGLTRLGGVMNLVVMSAAISTMLAAIYGLGRMLQSLADEGQAPAFLRAVDRRGAPLPALLTTGATMGGAVLLGAVLPHGVYLFLASSGAFALVFTYLFILVSHLRLRPRLGCPAGGCSLPGYPVTSYVGIAALLGVIVSMPFVKGQGAGLAAGLGLVAAATAAYVLLVRPRQHGPGPRSGEREPAPLVVKMDVDPRADDPERVLH